MSSSRRRATARCAAWHPASPDAHATVARALPGRRDRDIAPYRHYTREWHPAPSPAPRCRAPPPCSVAVHLRRATLVSRYGRARCPHRAAAPHGAVRGLASRASLPGPVIARPCCAPLPRTPPPRTPPPRHRPVAARTAPAAPWHRVQNDRKPVSATKRVFLLIGMFRQDYRMSA